MNKENSIKIRLMNIKTVIIVSITAVLMIITSCEKLIEVDQPDIIEQDQAFQDKNSTRLSIIGLYSLMADLVETLYLAGEVRADLVIATKSADPYIKEFSNNSFSASNPYISPKPFYTLINNTNDFIKKFEELEELGEMDTIDLVKYKSELIGIRVWTQYQIGKLYGKIKYYTDVVKNDNSTYIEDYEFDSIFLRKIYTDLEYSDSNNFTSINDPKSWHVVRFSDFYVNALMGEILLDLGEFQEAYEKFSEVIRYGDEINNRITTATRFKLGIQLKGFEWLIELFYRNWESASLADNAVFMIAFDNKYNQTNELRNWTNSLNSQTTSAEWFEEKFSEHAFTDLETDYRYYSLYYSKYFEDDKPFIMQRTARMALLSADCRNQLGIPNSSLSLLNQIRYRVDFTQLTMPTDTATSLHPEKVELWMEDVIMDELAYELAFEGQRWYDLMRIANRRDDPSYLADRVAQKYPEESRELIRSKLLDKTNWFLPIFE